VEIYITKFLLFYKTADEETTHFHKFKKYLNVYRKEFKIILRKQRQPQFSDTIYNGMSSQIVDYKQFANEHQLNANLSMCGLWNTVGL